MGDDNGGKSIYPSILTRVKTMSTPPFRRWPTENMSRRRKEEGQSVVTVFIPTDK